MGKFEKGKAKTGGRKKGVGNKKPQLKPLRMELAELGFNVGQALINELNNATETEHRITILKLIITYTNIVPVIETYKDEEDEQDDHLDDEQLLKAIK